MQFSPDYFLLWINQFGPIALFGLLAVGIVGLPIPDETLMTITGVLIAKGKMEPISSILFAISGSICGISISYFIGRTTGVYIIKKYGRLIGITEKKLEHAHIWFERWGKWGLFFGYFLPGVRHLTGIVAGAVSLETSHFMLFAYSGAIVWASLFLSLGYFFSGHWDVLVAYIEYHFQFAICLIIAFIIVSLITYYKWSKKRKC